MIMRKSKVLVILSAVALTSYCGKKKSDDDDAGDSDQQINSTNPLASSYPSSLAISAFPQTSTSLLGDDSEVDPDVEEKESAERLKGALSCAPEKDLDRNVKADTEVCYEFDQEMIYGSGLSGQTYGTQDGKNASGEACLAAFARSQIKEVKGRIKRARGAIEMMLCKAVKAGKAQELAEGAEVDLKDLAKEEGGTRFSSFTTAKIKRETDITDGDKKHKKFTTTVEWTLKGGISSKTVLTQVKRSDDGDYGVLYVEETAGDAAKTRVMTIAYGKRKGDDGKFVVQQQLRSMDLIKVLVNNTTYKHIGSDGQLDMAVGRDSSGNFTGIAGVSQANDAVSNITFIATSRKGKDQTISYWRNPGGTYTEVPRGMVATIVADSAGVLKGCASSGAAAASFAAGESIAKLLKAGTPEKLVPKGFYHPFFETESCTTYTTGSDTKGDFYQRATATGMCNVAKWYKLKAANDTFVTKQNGSLFSEQCYKRDGSIYKIDTDVTKSANGFEIRDSGLVTVKPPESGNIKKL